MVCNINKWFGLVWRPRNRTETETEPCPLLPFIRICRKYLLHVFAESTLYTYLPNVPFVRIRPMYPLHVFAQSNLCMYSPKPPFTSIGPNYLVCVFAETALGIYLPKMPFTKTPSTYMFTKIPFHKISWIWHNYQNTHLRKQPFIKRAFICVYQNRDYKLVSATNVSMVEYR